MIPKTWTAKECSIAAAHQEVCGESLRRTHIARMLATVERIARGRAWSCGSFKVEMPRRDKQRTFWHHSRHFSNAGDCSDASMFVAGHGFAPADLRACHETCLAEQPASQLQTRTRDSWSAE